MITWLVLWCNLGESHQANLFSYINFTFTLNEKF
jgi:hypothetical protein